MPGNPPPSAPPSPPPAPAWVVGGTAYLRVAQYEVELLGVRNALTDQTAFSGQAEFGQSGLSLKALVDSALETFDLSLPAAVPDLVFYRLSVAAVTAPESARSFRFVSLSRIVIPNPFSLASASLSFNQLVLSLCRQANPPPPPGAPGSAPAPTTWTTSLSVSASVEYTPGGADPDSAQSLGLGNASLALASGEYAIGLEVTAPIDPAKILSSVLGVSIQPDVAQFLPVFQPLSDKQPIRLYQASADFSCQRIALDGTVSTISYSAGFILDQLVISVLDLDFLVSLKIAGGGFTIAANCPVVRILPGDELLRVTGPVTDAEDAADFGPGGQGSPGAKQNNAFGPRLFVSSSATGKQVGLHAYLNFFPNGSVETLKVAFAYSFGADRLFTGSVGYVGTIAGISNPTFGFAWSKQAGFRITQFPFDQGALSAALDWASQFKKLANASQGACEKACGEIADLAFNEVIQTSFDIGFKPKSGGAAGKIIIEASGSYTVSVSGQSIADIVFDPIDLTIVIPTGFDDLANALLGSLEESAGSIALGLWNNTAQMTELFTLVTIKEGGQAALCRFTCKVGREALQKAFQALIDALANAAAGIAADTLAGAAAAVVAATGVIAAILRGLKWVWDEITGENARKKREAEAQRAAAQAKIQKLLTIPQMSAAYQQASGDGKLIHVAWTDIPAEKNPAQGNVYYSIAISYPGYSDTVTIARSGSNPQDNYAYDIRKPALANGQSIAISLTANYDYNDDHYVGPAAAATVVTPILQTPAPQVTLDWQTYQERKQGIVQAAWTACSVVPSAAAPGVTLVAYDIVFKNSRTGAVLDSVTNSGDFFQAPSTAFSYQLYADASPGPQGGFAPDPTASYQVVVIARASDPDLDSRPGASALFTIPWGIGYMRIGYNFKIDS